MKALWLLIAIFTVSCTDEDSSRKALVAQGFTDIQFTGYAAFDCSEDDNFATGFRAKNPNGLMVEGTVCCGIWKRCTLRF
jgi:hypothetical protein